MKTKPIIVHVLALAALLLSSCTAVDEAPPVEATEAESVAAVICTPGEETCDVGCYFDGGPSTDDCIIRCNRRGTRWITLENCGYAQNFPYSASCLDREPHPISQWN